MRIDVTSFTGSGTLRAQGGTSEGGGGGGGRIAVYYQSSSFVGSASAFAGSSTNGYGNGTQGTVYLRSNSGLLSVRGGLVELSGTDAVTGILFGPSGYLRLNGPAAITNPIVVPSGATLELNAGTALAAATLVSPIDGTLRVSRSIARTGDLVINGSLVLDAELNVTGNFTLSSAANATHSGQQRDSSLVVSGTLNVQGLFDVSGRGCGPATRFDIVGLTCVSGPATYSGGSHGGVGGSANIPAYGAQETPVYPRPAAAGATTRAATAARAAERSGSRRAR